MESPPAAPGTTPSDSSAPIRVVLVDDQALVRAGFSMVIDSQDDLEVVGQAGDGEEAVAIIARVQPDVVLMDVRMPRLNGIQATGRVLALADEGAIRTPRIIVLTTFDEDEYALAALRGGASGFLLKDVLPEILLDSIRTVVRGGAVIAPTTTRRLLDTQLFQATQGVGAETHTRRPRRLCPQTLRPQPVRPQLLRPRRLHPHPRHPRPPHPAPRRPHPHSTLNGPGCSPRSRRASERCSNSWGRA